MNADEVRKLIQQGEGQQVEFKRSFAEEKDVIISLCAFTHAEGGTVFIGVKDDGCIDGADLGKNTIENFANKVKQNSQPPLTPLIQSISLAKKTVVVTSIQRAAPGQRGTINGCVNE
jgi:ATP-dependent DNA helicase RecG